MSFDYYITQLLNSYSGKMEILDETMLAITKLGPYLILVLIAVRWYSRENRKLQRHMAIGCAFAASLALLVNQLILLYYQRPRPYTLGLTHLLVQKSTDPSFPSDHATFAFGVAVYLILNKDRRSLYFFILAVLICVSRIYVGTHFLTDVLGGAAIGTIAAFAVNRIYPKLESLTSLLVKIG